MKRLIQLKTIVSPAASIVLLIFFLNAAALADGAWTSVRSKNFLLVGDADEKDIRAVAVRLEQFRDAFHQIYPSLKLTNGVETRVIVFRNTASYRDFKPKRSDGTPDDAVAGFFVPGDDVNYITLSAAGEKSDPLETAAHEYLHAVLDANYHRLEIPLWLNEGLAEYFQTFRVGGNKDVVIGTPRIESLSMLRRNKLISVKDLIETDADRLSSMADQPRSLFYAEAAVFVHYLMQTGVGTPEVRLRRLLALLDDKESGENMFQKNFQKNYADTETALRRYLDPKSQLSAFAAEQLGSLSETSLSPAALRDPEVYAFLGDLLGHLDETDKAEQMLRKAVALDQNSTLANSALGMLLMRRDQFTDAKQFLARAAAADNANCLTQFNYAYAISREGADADGNIAEISPETEKLMRAALQRAISLNPDFTESYRLLAFVDYVNGGDLNEAVSLLTKGLVLKPKDQDLEMLLAQVLLRQEKYADAKDLAVTVRKSASDAKLLSDADEVLRTVDEYYAVRPKTYEADGAGFDRIPRLLFLKRSSVSDADIARFEEDRRINNINQFLARPRPGEKQVVGYIESVSCMDDGIGYAIRTTEGKMFMTGKDFGDLRLAVLTEGQNSYRIDCGMSFGKQLMVLTYRPTADTKARRSGQLSGITFVPDYFRLKTLEELAKARTVVVEDDTPRGSRRREIHP